MDQKTSKTATPVVVGITGATGVVFGTRLLQILREKHIESHLVVSKWAERIVRSELGLPLDEIKAMADCCCDSEDLDAPISSGSFKTMGEVIIPCSMKTLARDAIESDTSGEYAQSGKSRRSDSST